MKLMKRKKRQERKEAKRIAQEIRDKELAEAARYPRRGYRN